MSPEVEEQEVEEPAVWQYQLRNSKGEVIGEWSTPAESKFEWPKGGRAERWIKKNKRWARVK